MIQSSSGERFRAIMAHLFKYCEHCWQVFLKYGIAVWTLPNILGNVWTAKLCFPSKYSGKHRNKLTSISIYGSKTVSPIFSIVTHIIVRHICLFIWIKEMFINFMSYLLLLSRSFSSGSFQFQWNRRQFTK